MIDRWKALSRREQRLLVAALALTLVAGLYWGVYSPLKVRAENAASRVVAERNLLAWVEQKAVEIESLRAATGNRGSAGNEPLNQIVTSSVGRYELEIVRLQPQRDDLQVWLKPMPFNSLLGWLDYLTGQQGLKVIFIDIGKGEANGLVEINRLQLGRG